MLNLAIGLVIGFVGALAWVRFRPGKVDKFIAKYEAEIRAKLK